MFIKVDKFIVNKNNIVFITPIENNSFKIELRDKHFVNIANNNEIEMKKIYDKLTKALSIKDI